MKEDNPNTEPVINLEDLVPEDDYKFVEEEQPQPSFKEEVKPILAKYADDRSALLSLVLLPQTQNLDVMIERLDEFYSCELEALHKKHKEKK